VHGTTASLSSGEETIARARSGSRPLTTLVTLAPWMHRSRAYARPADQIARRSEHSAPKSFRCRRSVPLLLPAGRRATPPDRRQRRRGDRIGTAIANEWRDCTVLHATCSAAGTGVTRDVQWIA
jgi:hypothetical protein